MESNGSHVMGLSMCVLTVTTSEDKVQIEIGSNYSVVSFLFMREKMH